jgi:endonuclease-3
MAEKTIKHTTSEIKRRTQILNVLHKLYPDPRSELEFKDPYELVVAVALSAQCTDKKVNEVTKNLFKQFPTFQLLSNASLDKIENIIRQVNYFKTKSKNIKLLAEKVCTEFNGSLPLTHQELTSLPGVGNKTANVVLSELNITPAFPVDTHVFRVSRRLKLARGKDVLQVEASLKKNFKPEQWHDLHHWLIFHGRRVCKSQNPSCDICPLNKLCPSNSYKK